VYFVECTPIKATPPQDHSTPLDGEKAASKNAKNEDVIEDEDDEQSPFHFCCTQDTLAVGWDCGSPQRKPSKRIGK
jgi:hypothetical protein